MTDRIERAALAAAKALAPEYGPSLETDVLAVLHSGTERRDHYVDPVSIASLVVSVASLAWNIYQGTKSKDVIARRIRVELPPSEERDRIIELVVDDIADDIVDEDET